MKYISIDMSLSGITRRLVTVFPEAVTHEIMARALISAYREEWPRSLLSVHAAGFTNAQMVDAHGKGESMGGVKSDPMDAQMFNTSDYSGNIL